jgi:hypothetical protein
MRAIHAPDISKLLAARVVPNTYPFKIRYLTWSKVKLYRRRCAQIKKKGYRQV